MTTHASDTYSPRETSILESRSRADGRQTASSQTNPPLAVDLRDIHMTFRGNVTAVDSVSLQIKQGEVVALLGQNGAGKTTLIDIALGLQKPKRGTATLLGMTPQDAVSRGLIGAVNQTGALPADYKVGQLISLFHGFYDDPLDIDQVMSLTHLEGLQKRGIGKLSGGEQQRLRLALALIPDPLLLFLDEPTSGMDPAARQDFWRVMNRAAGDGRTIVFATHYLAEAESFAQRTAIMREGKLVADAPTVDLMRRGTGTLQIRVPKHSYEAAMASLNLPDLSITWEGGTLTVGGRDLDDVARILLSIEGAHNLRITDSTLEDVFTDIARGSNLEGSDAK